MRIVIAISVWAFAIIGAIGVARWLELPQVDSILIVIVVACISFFGTFLPVLRAQAKI